MKKNQQNHKEIRIILIVLIVLAFLSVGSKLFDFYHIRMMHTIANDIHQNQLHTYVNLEIINISTSITVLLLFFAIAYYLVTKIFHYIAREKHLTGVLKIIRDVNQLIVREKNKQKLIQDTCAILISSELYSNASIILYDDTGQIKDIANSDVSENFSAFRKKIASGWTPHCIKKITPNNKPYSFISKTKDTCFECPLVDCYETTSAISLQLKHKEKIYGYITLSVDTQYIHDQEELLLLKEVASDIAYALYNLQSEQTLQEHTEAFFSLKELYMSIINSVDNILFVKDTKFTYIVCNRPFEELVGKSRDEIVGKTDYDIFEKDVADFFRENDTKMLEQKKARSNFEWVTYPNGERVYLFTVKSPLVDSGGNSVGLVGNSVDFTERKKAENDLKKSQENYQLLADNALDLIWKMNMELEFTYVNPSVKTILGYTAEEFVGTKLYEHCDLEEFTKMQAIASEMLHSNRDEGVSLEACINRKDGREIVLELNGKLIFDDTHTPIGFQGSARDFTSQAEARQKLRDALFELEKKSQELQTILQEAPNPIMLHNEAGEVLMVNKVWETLSGYSYNEINTIDKWIQKACNNKDSLFKENMENLYALEHKIDLGEASITTKEGNSIIWQFSCAPLGVINGKHTIVTSAMDITDLKKKDEMMIVQSRHAAMGEMIGMIAHQWRQPISCIAMDANNMMMDIGFDTFDTVTAEEYAKNILEQTQHLSKTIDDFRNFFKPDKSRVSLKLQNLMDETLTIVKDSLANNTISLQISYLSQTEVDVYPRELMQVFVNIINNSRDALMSDHTPNALIEIKIYDDEYYVNTEICDNGSGIDATILPKIFDPYFSTKDDKTGTGLGLYMSKMIVEEHLHGKIEVSNNQDKGACFKVRLLKRSDYK